MPSAKVVEMSVTTVTTVSRGVGGEWGGEKRGYYWSTWIPELPCVGTNIITLSLWLCQFPCLGSSSSPSKQICTVDDNVTFKIWVLVILILDIRSRLTVLLDLLLSSRSEGNFLGYKMSQNFLCLGLCLCYVLFMNIQTADSSAPTGKIK